MTSGLSAPRRSGWCRIFRPRPAATTRLICFPQAGGAASTFHGWAERLPESVELVAVQYAGRQDRADEEPIGDVGTTASLVAADLEPLFDRQVAFFGHSLGATIAFEVARKLHPRFPTPISRLIVSARLPPSRCLPRGDRFRSDEELRRYLGRAGGRSAEVLASEELWRLAVPALRGDLRMADSYTYVEGAPLTCPITVIAAEQDHGCGPADLRGWAAHTIGALDEHVVPGDHFYVNAPGGELFTVLVDALGAR
ncbi:thioesterase II family protein [Amycolatopsis sp. 195334CR]|uniref:thioesterase II family protein n=1 Tax=Amycolatopsis sp. 195334CR TaxID=2814588 RepID=UPI001A905A5C|nr:alpha/beta fold hydrolase [Amycolatopsis sp. 195334CR]MBN6039751.1 thioesterase [Amycolatopsis sp. 195334CR]